MSAALQMQSPKEGIYVQLEDCPNLGISDHDKHLNLWKVGELGRAGLAHEQGVCALSSRPCQSPDNLSCLQKACHSQRAHHNP